MRPDLSQLELWFVAGGQNLYGAVQRLMSKGYGFGAEGDWQAAALVREMKVVCGLAR